MKKSLVLVAALALATAGTTFAQTATPAAPMAAHKGKGHHGDKKTPAEKADHRAAKLAKELGLAPDQENRVEQILLAEQTEMKALHDKAKAEAHKGMSPEKQAVRAKYDAQLKAAMTAEQYAKFEATRKEHHEKMMEHHGGKMENHGDKMKMKTKAKS